MPANNVGMSDSPKAPEDSRQPVSQLPLLLTVGEAASLLRTSRGAVYAMVSRSQLPGITRIGSRLLFQSRDLLDWLDQKCALSPRR
jgi:excisionase family DNA binding protein